MQSTSTHTEIDREPLNMFVEWEADTAVIGLKRQNSLYRQHMLPESPPNLLR
jgi:hypothetical protein